jgi:predicted alpha-1,2-mannosidase
MNSCKSLSLVLTSGLLYNAYAGGVAPRPVDEALPMVGTGAHGHTYPGATVPFGFVQLSPDTRTEGWDACSGYHYSDNSILGFSHRHLSGTGCADLGDLLLMPLASPPGPEPWKADRFRSSFSHEQELAQPGYYRVMLDKDHILAELTATAHAGMHRYTFPPQAQCHLLVDLVHGLNSPVTLAALKIESPTLVTGYRQSGGWANGKTVFFALEFVRPIVGSGLELEGKSQPAGLTEATGKQVRAHLDFGPSGGEPLVVRVGLSAVSAQAAQQNLKSEIPAWDFDAVRSAAQAAWNQTLSRIRIESADPNIRQTFYSALYHTMTAPTLYNDADGTYLGTDHKVHASPGFQYYCTLSLWDSFRAEHPLMTLVQPDRVNDFIRTMLAFAQQSEQHRLPMWPLASCETGCMIGYHAVPVIADAYAKGFRDYDIAALYEAIRHTAMDTCNHQDEYQRLGYVPSENGKRNEATSRTLEFGYDDWCIAQLAKALGKTQDAALFAKRALTYTNVFDPATGFFRGRTAAGAFREPFDPKAVSFDDFTEANAWQYAFAVMQDVPGMIRLYGGEDAFIRKLDQFFNEDSDIHNYLIDVSGLLGQYAHGNEPCHHVAYLYALAGAQYKTALRARQIMLMQYDNTPGGLCGNDDCGQMSAWYVFSAMGLYPLNPANGIYVIGSPLVEKATIQLDPQYYKGGSFTVLAHNVSRQNAYIQSAKLNGRPLDRPWVTHEELSRGGTLELEMDILPSLHWNQPPKKSS